MELKKRNKSLPVSEVDSSNATCKLQRVEDELGNTKVTFSMPNEQEELRKEVDEVLASAVSVSTLEHFSTLVFDLVKDVVSYSTYFVV